MKVYQLVAVGSLSGLEGRGTIHSRVLFRSLAKAEENVESFRRKALVQTGSLNDLCKVERISVLELEVEE